MLRNDWMNGWTRRNAWLTMLAAILLVASPAMSTASSSVPVAVVSTVNTVPATGLAGDESNVVLDACGNIYAIQQYGGEVDEIPSGGGAATVVIAAGGDNYRAVPLAIDSAKSNLYFLHGDSGNLYKVPITNCTPQPGSVTTFTGIVTNLGAVSYYWNGSSVATDTAGDVFIGTNVACCAPVNELLVEYGFNGYTTGATLVGGTTGLAAPITSIAIDASGNIYYVSGGALYELQATTAATSTTPPVYSATPVSFGSGYTTVVGVVIDGAGNMYVSDSGNSAIYEIPYETSGGTAALNPADQFIVAMGTGITIANAVAPDPSGNLYYANNGSSVYELTRNNVNFGSRAVASPGTTTLDVVFNAAVTPATIGFVTNNGVFASATGGTCAAKTAYAAGGTCTVNASFTPAAPGLAEGALVLADSTGTALTTANLYGTGLGAGLTIDPGTPTPTGSGLNTPMSVALDVSGDIFLADSGAGKVWEIPAGNGTPIAIGSGFSSPKGVAVDGAGNVYVADTGNNQIVMVPVINGVLSTPGQTTLVSGGTNVAGSALSSPDGLSADAQGNLYIADTGNNRVLFLPQNNDWDVNGAFTLGSGFSSPLATAVSASGLIYIADSGNGKIYSIPYLGAAAPLTVVATGFNNPSALGTDAAGDLFVVDQGNTRVMRIPKVAGSLATGSSANVSLGIANPYGLAIDSAGNLYVSDNVNAAAYVVARTSPTLSFGNVNPGSSSDPASVQVESAGNQALVLGTPYYVATGNTDVFVLTSSETNACASGASVAVGENCILEATFTPPTDGTFSETLALSSNATNTSAPEVKLTGVGITTLATATTLTVTSPSGTPYYGQAIALSASVTASVGTPTGSVALTVDGSQVATASLNNGTATFSLSNGLTGGSHTLEAIYQGATTSTAVYARSVSAVDTIVVSAVTTTTAISFTTLYTNPPSQPAGTVLTLTATVSSTFTGIPTGDVTFTITNSGAATVTTSAPLMAASGGVFQATFSYTPPAPATGASFDAVSVAASYGGDNNFSGSSSASQSFNVGPAIGSVVITPSGTSLTGGSGNGSSTITFTNTSYGGWQGVVGYQCLASSLPANAICVFSPGQVTVMASTSTASYPTATTKLQVLVNNPPNSPAQSSMLWWLGGLTGLFLLWTRRRLVRGAWGTLAMLIGGALLAVSASGVMACSKNVPTYQYPTPAGSSTITVVAYSDPYLSVSKNTTQTCGLNSAGKPDPTVSPCSEPTFQVSLTVQ